MPSALAVVARCLRLSLCCFDPPINFAHWELTDAI
jgi:hypothetical protein